MPIVITVGAGLLAFVITLLSGLWMIPFLRKLHFGQTILEEGPAWHKSKQGTPIMGGFLFLFGSVISTLTGYLVWYFAYAPETVSPGATSLMTKRLVAAMVFAMLYSFLVGFLDDYIKAVKKQNLGLRPMQKIVIQVVLCSLYLGILYWMGDHNTKLDLLFVELDLGIFYYPLMIVFMIYLTNAVNLTDGVDGLCSSAMVVAMGLLWFLCNRLPGEGGEGFALYALCIAASCLGFLFWNFHPAKVFMGDTGSMYLGAAFTGIGIAMHQHLTLVLIGIVFVLDALSVVVQVSYFKYTKKKYGAGRRIFKMSPIHHHFEMCQWSEEKIVLVFSSVGLVVGVLAIICKLL